MDTRSMLLGIAGDAVLAPTLSAYSDGGGEEPRRGRSGARMTAYRPTRVRGEDPDKRIADVTDSGQKALDLLEATGF